MKTSYLTTLFDSKNNKILYLSERATSKFWDKFWSDKMKNTFKNPPNHKYTTFLTKKYLPLNSLILEGGCGIGDKVFALNKFGFKTKGIDFAPNVVKNANKHWPHLDIEIGDLRNLKNIKTNTVDGYWSLGVIEHFFEGYKEISNEMHRVIIPGGYLFITFPMINCIRFKKAKNKQYLAIENFNIKKLKENFYQYALDPEKVISDFEKLEFSLCHRGGLSSFDNISSELSWTEKFFKFIKYLPFNLYTKLGLLFDILFGKNFGHTAILIFKKKSIK